MPKIITYKVPALDKGKIVTIEKQGYVAHLYVGDVQEKFILQLGFDGTPEHLVHYATGKKFGDTLVSAMICLAAARVRAVMASAPILNA